MALTDESNGNGFYMPVAPAYGGGYGNGGFGFGGDWAWILLLLLIGGGGWGMGGFGGGMMWPMMMGGMAGGWDLYPWLNNSEHISDGFRDQMLQTSVSSLGDKITSGFGDVATQLCGGFAGVNAGIANAAAQAEIGANARQMSTMQQLFGIQSAQQQCCCDTRAGIADLKYTVATEACADRAAVTQGIQTVLDKLCQLELDGVKGQLAQAQRENVGLQNQLNMAAMRESQTAQNALFQQGLNNEVDALYNRLNTCPVPTTPVYGRTPIFTCGGNTGCGCNGNGFMN
jgi:hypothetical protein